MKRLNLIGGAALAFALAGCATVPVAEETVTAEPAVEAARRQVTTGHGDSRRNAARVNRRDY